ncbi:MAG: hypothetical protein WD716_01195 [Fimbriimonadaceae bacterium]
MVSAVILAVLVQDKQYQPVFPKLFPRPTSANGLEEYVRALDIVHGQQLATKYFDVEATPEETLDLKLKCASETDAVARLIEQGNAKPLDYPPGHTAKAIEDLSYNIYVVGRVLWRRGEGLLALGRTDEGFAQFEALLVMGRRIGHLGTLLTYLRGRSILNYGLNGYHDYRTHMPLPFTKRLDALSVDLLQPTLLEECLQRDNEATDELMAEAIAEAGIVRAAQEFLGVERDLGDERTLTREYEKWLEFYRSQTRLVLKADEANWSREIDRIFVGNQEEMPPGQAMAHGLMNLRPDILRLELRQRAQIRMLRLYGKIAEYRWLNGTYPAQLEQVGTPTERTDPLTGQEFHYANQGESFDLYSSGIPELGEIRVRYRRAN